MEKIIFIVLFGLVWGSFLNVVIYRLPSGMSLLRPPSSCPRCKKNIKFYDNIPVISFLLLKGRCRFCKEKIPFSYPLVEFMAPASFLLLYSQHSLSFFFFASCLFASAMIVLGIIDFYHQILPDEITLPGLVLALVYSLFRQDLNLTQALVGAVAGAGFLLFVYGAYYLLRKKEGLGMGDVTMMLFMGAYLGWRQAFLALILASFAGAIVGIFFILFKKKDFQYSLPFGTFLSPAAFAVLLWGEKIIKSYLSLYKDLAP
ncbi:MAG: prepilin peptidase [Candidatus Aminicenantes bacterium]|nr:MAG: prepilin peptidase [Candidatus Aminicenantes bacterium]